jgi:hypothetical protein
MKKSLKIVEVTTTLRKYWNGDIFDATDHILMCNTEPVINPLLKMYSSNNEIISWSIEGENEVSISRAAKALIVKEFIDKQLEEYE